MLSVAPTVHIPTTRLGQSLGKETILDCTATALPHATIHWEKDGNKISGAGRCIVEPYEEGDHKVVLSLRIRDLTREDYGVYHCVASNSLGFHNGSMLLYGTRAIRDCCESLIINDSMCNLIKSIMLVIRNYFIFSLLISNERHFKTTVFN